MVGFSAMRSVVAFGLWSLLAMTVASCGGPSDRVPTARYGFDATRSTGRGDLTRTITTLRERVAKGPLDGESAARLTDALLRQTRVSNNATLALEAERTLDAVLSREPRSYEARRALATVRLSQHRFRDALVEVERLRTEQSNDDVVWGIAGDAHLELGEYGQAFAAFDEMNRLKPTAASFRTRGLRRELQGDLNGALTFMRMALGATPASDAEGLAWHRAQLGHLHLERGEIDDAAREYAHADFVFPDHPFASEGLARVAASRGQFATALGIVRRRLDTAPLPSDFALAGNLLSALGHPDDAERHYRLAEAAWRSDVPEPGQLARFMAERGRNTRRSAPDRAVGLHGTTGHRHD